MLLRRSTYDALVYRYVRPLRDTGIKRSGTDLRPRGAKRRGRLRPPFLLPPFRLQRTVHVRLPPSHKHHAGAVGGETLARHVYFWRCTASCPSPPRSPRSARSSPCPTTCRCRATAPRPAETLRPGVRVRDSFGWCGRKRQDGQVCTAKRSVTPSILCSLTRRTYL